MENTNRNPSTSNNKTSFTKYETKDSGIDILDDSFDCLEDTQTLINKNKTSVAYDNNVEEEFSNFLADGLKKAEIKAQVKKAQDFDAFEIYLENSSVQNKSRKSNLEYDNSQLSQFFNKTQVREQLDSLILQVNNSSKTSQNKDEFSTNADSNLKSILYKKEVDNLFDKLELTICELGPDNKKCEKLETNDNVEKTILFHNLIEKVKSHKGIQNDDWSSETSLADILNLTEIENMSAIIKESFFQQASQFFNSTKVTTNLVVCKRLGNFYDLPAQVKDLIKLYKGIDKLYGKLFLSPFIIKITCNSCL